MKKYIAVIVLLLLVTALGCEKKQQGMTLTGPGGEKASVSFNK